MSNLSTRASAAEGGEAPPRTQPARLAPPLAFIGASSAGFGLALLLVRTSWGWPWLAVLALGLGVALMVYGLRRPLPTPLPTPAPPADPPAEPEGAASRPATTLAAPTVITTTNSPRIVAIGGGTGMPQLLRGLRAYTDHITAIVTVADDGGSSGRLRRQMGVLPPGDFRNNIAALSQAEELMTRLFQYRFADSDVDGNSSELAGHSFGNLFITTMAAVTGSFERGLAESSRVLAVRGRVLPSTLEYVTLCAEVCFTRPDGSDEWRVVEGESNITEAGGRIMRVFLKPDAPPAYPEVIRAILQADLIVAGPGSFFTSVMPNLLVPAIRAAICAAPAPRIYLCNVATQRGETDDYTVSDHMRQLRYHAGDAFTTVLANHNYDPARPPASRTDWVLLPPADEQIPYRLFTGDVVDEAQPWRHSSNKLAARLIEVYAELRAG
ncbi:MAG: hypothetical protein DCC55_21250 [Chloroflexi bacterium]|nr:MAG: hypothetical protein DCC55_21250 [Chloroflexota bacterium]